MKQIYLLVVLFLLVSCGKQSRELQKGLLAAEEVILDEPQEKEKVRKRPTRW